MPYHPPSIQVRLPPRFHPSCGPSPASMRHHISASLDPAASTHLPHVDAWAPARPGTASSTPSNSPPCPPPCAVPCMARTAAGVRNRRPLGICRPPPPHPAAPRAPQVGVRLHLGVSRSTWAFWGPTRRAARDGVRRVACVLLCVGCGPLVGVFAVFALFWAVRAAVRGVSCGSQACVHGVRKSLNNV